MQIDNELLNKLQKLGMIEIEESKKEEIKAQLSEILGFVDNLSTLPTQERLTQRQEGTPLREDIPQDSQIQDDVLSHAPQVQERCFVVPKIIE